MLKPLAPFALAASVLLGALTGCETNRVQPSDGEKPAPASTSSVPLRMWIVGQVSDPSLVERAWLTGSDQKLEIRTLTAAEFLAEPACDCDVALLPARLLGEMLDRKWLTKLPNSLTAPDELAPQVPTAWERQVSYGGERWGVPLGCSVPLAIVSAPAAETAAQAENWNSLLESLAIRSADKPAVKIDPASVDRDALVDRYFAILGGLSQRTPDYGLLFELQTMKPRLTEPEFVRAAEILLSLLQQATDDNSTAIQAVVGDSSQAWSWINAQTQPALTIVTPALLNAAAARETGSKALRIPKKWIGWNTGSGLIAAQSTYCRQSARATELLRWLRQSETRHTLSPLIVGVESASPSAGADSSASQASGIANELANNSSLPSELRLPRAAEYRNALASSLVAILSGAQPIADSLAEAAAAWQSITDARGREVQRSDYEQSLGLIRD
jgi:hypothetical protein